MLNASRRRLIPCAALALLLAGLALMLRPSRREYVDLLRRAEEHAEQIERTAAVAAYREAAGLRPAAPLPHLSLAALYLDWGRPDDALDAVAEGERLGAESVDVEQLRLAIHVASAETSVAAKPEHWRAAVEHAQRLLALQPADREARHALARAYLGLREWEAARSVYRELLRSNPDDQTARERLGALLLGEDPSAIVHLDLAQTELSRRLLAVFGEAASAGDRVYACMLGGRVLIEGQEWPLAAHQLELAVAHSPDYADANAYLGHALDQMGYREDALIHLLEATAAAPESPVAHMLLGLHYDRWGDPSSARAEYETAHDLAPEDPGICVEIGQTWAAEARYVAAEIWLRQAISLRPDDPELWEILTRFYLDNSITSDDRAGRAAEELVELAPESAEANDLRGWAALEMGDYEAAEAHLELAIELEPGLASAYYHLGLLQRTRGHPGQAREAFARAIDLDTTGKLRPLIHRVTIGESSADGP